MPDPVVYVDIYPDGSPIDWGLQQAFIFRVSGIDGKTTPWATDEEMQAACNAYVAALNGPVPDSYTIVQPSQYHLESKWAAPVNRDHLDHAPAPTGAVLEEIANYPEEWFPPPPPMP